MTTQLKAQRVVFIGAGAIVQRAHIPNFQRLAGIETTAICDTHAARAQEVAAAAAIPHVYTDYEKMLAEEKPDITVVATPNLFHKPMTLAALEVGSHVLCEKPLALSYADAQEMVAIAQAKGLVLSVGTHLRYAEPTQAVKTHVDAGMLGKIYAARTVWQRRSGIPGYGGWFTNKELAGGGALLDIGIHALDRALYLMGYPEPATVSGVFFSELGPRGLGRGGWANETVEPIPDATFEVDDLAWAFIRFADGSALIHQVAWAAHMPEQALTELFGSDGGASLTLSEAKLYTTLRGQTVDIVPTLPATPTPSYSRLVEHFVRHLQGDPAAEIMSPQQVLTSAAIVDAILRSAQAGREIDLREENLHATVP